MQPRKAYRCELLGRFRLFGPDGEEIRVPVAKGVAIVAYLLLSGEKSVQRSSLTALLWSERSEAVARTALRQCLHQMKSRLKDGALDLIEITQEIIQLKTSNIETDISELTEGRFNTALEASKLDMDRLLHGLEDLDPAFSEWLWEQRRHQKSLVCKELTYQLENSKDDEDRLKIAEALHQLKPCLEIAARPLIEKQIRLGNIVELLSIYKKLWDALDDQWEEEPSQELQELVGNARVTLGKVLPALPNSEAKAPVRRFVSVLALRYISNSPDYDNKELLSTFNTSAAKALSDNGAVLFPGDENSLYAVFGLPGAQEDDAQIAISSALRLKKQFLAEAKSRPSIGQSCKLSIGLDAGLIDIPNQTKIGKCLSGPPVIGAQDLACPNEEFVSIQAPSHMVRRLKHKLKLQPRNRSNRSNGVVRILDETGHKEQEFSERVNGLVGRVHFMTALRTAWIQAQTEGIQIICLQGPAGIGKTRLAQEFLHNSIDQAPILASVRCSRYDRIAPLEAVHTILQKITRQKTDASATPKILLQKLTEALGDKTGVLFIDDWHWIDDASRSVFQNLAVTLQDRPLLLIVTARDTSLDDGLIRTSHQLQLPPLNAKEVERRAEQVLGRPIDTTLKSKIFEKSGGNPLYLEEICRALSPSDLNEKHDLKQEAFSADLHALIASRVDHLENEDTKIVFAIAVHGETVEQKLLSEVLGYEVPQARLKRLCALDLLRPDLSGSRLQFKHGITRDVTYAMIPEVERNALHQSYFKAFLDKASKVGTNDFVENLALHAQASGSIIDAIEFSEQAGDKALAASSLDQAERQFRTALTLIEKLDQATDWKARWLSIALRWARPCVYAASIDHLPVLEKAQKLAADLRDDAKLCEILYWTGYNLIVRGEFTQATDHLRRSKSLAKALGLARLDAEATAILGCAFTLQTRYTEAEHTIELAMGAKDQHPVRKGRAPVTSVYLQSILAVICGEKGNFDLAEDKLDTAISRVSEFEHEIESSILTTGSIVLVWRGQWEKARDFARRARHRSEQVSAPYMIGTSRCLFCYSDWKITGNPENLAELQRTAHWLDAQGMRLFLTLILGWLSDALVDAERYEDAASIAMRVLERSEESGEYLGTSMACRTLARCAMAPKGSGAESALKHIQDARQWATYRGADHEHGACALLEAQIFEQIHQPETAESSLNEAIFVFEQLGMTPFLEKARSLRKPISIQIS